MAVRAILLLNQRLFPTQSVALFFRGAHGSGRAGCGVSPHRTLITDQPGKIDTRQFDSIMLYSPRTQTEGNSGAEAGGLIELGNAPIPEAELRQAG